MLRLHPKEVSQLAENERSHVMFFQPSKGSGTRGNQWCSPVHIEARVWPVGFSVEKEEEPLLAGSTATQRPAGCSVRKG